MEIQKKSAIARQLTEARVLRRGLEQWSQAKIHMTRSEAYQIQELGIQHRLNQAESRIGYKMGLTSEGKRKQMNLDSPLYGELTNKMQILNSSIFDLKPLIHSKIEPEVAFKIKSTLKGRVDYDTVVANITHTSAAMEILDSRYTQFKYFSMEDVIADNSSSSHFVLGNWIPFESPKILETARLEMYVNDDLTEAGDAKDISGDPIQSVVQLCELLHENGRELEAGSIVLAGAATAAVELKPNQKIELKIKGTKVPLPSALVHIKGN